MNLLNPSSKLSASLIKLPKSNFNVLSPFTVADMSCGLREASCEGEHTLRMLSINADMSFVLSSAYFKDHNGAFFCFEYSFTIAQRASVRLLMSLYPGSSLSLKLLMKSLLSSPASLDSNLTFRLLFVFSVSHALNILTTASTKCCATKGLPFVSKSCLIYLLIANETMAIHAYDGYKP